MTMCNKPLSIVLSAISFILCISSFTYARDNRDALPSSGSCEKHGELNAKETNASYEPIFYTPIEGNVDLNPGISFGLVNAADTDTADKEQQSAGYLGCNNTHINDDDLAEEIKQCPDVTPVNLDDNFLFIDGSSSLGIQYVGPIHNNIRLHAGICYDYRNLINLPTSDAELSTSANTNMNSVFRGPILRIMATW